MTRQNPSTGSRMAAVRTCWSFHYFLLSSRVSKYFSAQYQWNIVNQNCDKATVAHPKNLRLTHTPPTKACQKSCRKQFESYFRMPNMFVHVMIHGVQLRRQRRTCLALSLQILNKSLTNIHLTHSTPGPKFSGSALWRSDPSNSRFAFPMPSSSKSNCGCSP